MKKKGPRGIPDFSAKKKGPPVPDAPQGKHAIHSTPPREPIAKPQATSQKSGRRGA
ncbi:MAG: hypothetical protein ABI556_06745 [Gemmatimonadales bacterium]